MGAFEREGGHSKKPVTVILSNWGTTTRGKGRYLEERRGKGAVFHRFSCEGRDTLAGRMGCSGLRGGVRGRTSRKEVERGEGLKAGTTRTD